MTIRGCLAGVSVGDGLDVAVVGALNVSPESFYAGSVMAGADDLLRAAEAMVTAGAALLDVGAMSTAPYLSTAISATEERDRLGAAVHLLATKVSVPLSVDTSRAAPAEAALDAGARIVNDVRGLTADPDLARVVARAEAGLILMASPRGGAPETLPVEAVRGLLEESLALARDVGIPAERIAVDPGIGFFRSRAMAWHEWDCRILAGLTRLRELGRPICVGVSRKSFIGAVTGARDPAHRLPGSLAATAAAVLGGAHLIRTHDVAETLQAVRVAHAIRDAGGK
ncbi:MAG TPA: dihydropteroate synthase [Candidatus Limnocylindrales bacterium]|nr:dihydropteroate synthase [Candidatus Limnocylindrales bacterium]